MKIAINGFGRIGRSIYRIICQDPSSPYQIVAINDLSPKESLSYLLKYDSVMRTLPMDVKMDGEYLSVGKQKTKMLNVKELDKLPWKDLGVDVVIEATGAFLERAKLELHLSAGAKKYC